MATHPDRHLPLKDTIVCHLQEDTTRITTREETMREMTGGTVDRPRGVESPDLLIANTNRYVILAVPLVLR